MSAPRVSVIMIFLDAGPFIHEAFDSVRAQTFTDWELILVDDGSTDESTDLARSWAATDPDRVHYLEHPGHANLGMSRSRNAGVRAARGELVAFLDADDVYRPEKLERQVALLEEHADAAMVMGATEHWYSWTGDPADAARDRPRRLGVPADTLVEPPGLLLSWLRGEGHPPGTCGVLVRREAFDDVGGFEDRFRGMFEDQAFFSKLALRHPVFVESGSWDRYRQHPASHVSVSQAADDGPNDGPSRAAFLDWLEALATASDPPDRDVQRAMRRIRWAQEHPQLERVRRRLRRELARRS